MKRGTQIHDYLHRLDELIDQLVAIGEVSDVRKVAMLL